jgi:signal transduction histidine kinase
MKLLPGTLQLKVFLRFLLVASILLLLYSGIWIVIAGNQANNAAPLQDIILFAGLLLMTTIIFAALLFLTLENSDSLSLKKLLKGKEHFEKGNLDYRIDVQSNDEFEEIAHGLNTLAGKLNDAFGKLEQDKGIMRADHNQVNNLLKTEEDKLHYLMFAEREKVNYVLSAVTDGVIILNKDRKVMLINKVAEELTGYLNNEIVNKPINGVVKFYDKDREISWDEYAPLQSSKYSWGTPLQNNNNNLKEGISLMQKARLESPNIKPRIVNLTSMKAKFSQSADLGYIIVLHSMTQELQAEKMEMDFVASVAGEMQQPLRLISEALNFLKQNNQSPENINMSLTGIQMGTDQLSIFLDNLFMITGIEQQTIVLTPQSLDLVTIIKQALASFSSQALGRGVTLVFEEPKETSPQVTAEPVTLRKVLVNLLLNAILYTPSGGTVTVSMSEMGTDVVVHIQDTGVGIPQDSMNNLFTKFYRIPNANIPSGAGLGLYICKSLIEMQQGKIWVDSVQGKGSNFSFSLPKANGN